MPDIHIKVKNKIAVGSGYIVLDNSDYNVVFAFDDEWTEFTTKTMRVQIGTEHIDTIFEGDSVPLPKISDISAISIGVFAGDIRTTTPALISCRRSVLTAGGTPQKPGEDVYAQIMEKLNSLEGGEVSSEQIAAAIEQYFEENPPEIAENDPTVPEWAKQPQKPEYTADEVGADSAGTAADAVAEHNIATDAHNDIRLLIEDLSKRFNALADSDDIDLDQLSEIIAYIQANRGLIDSVTTAKVSYTDIVDDLTTNVANRPLSAAQGAALKQLIDAITVPTKLSELTDDALHRTVTDAEKTAWTNKSDFSGRYADLTGLPTGVSEFQNDAGYISVSRNVFTNGETVGLSTGNSEWAASEEITALTVTYPEGDFEAWVKFTTAASGDISISMPLDNYIGSLPEFGNGETWEVSIKNGVVIAGKVEVNSE